MDSFIDDPEVFDLIYKRKPKVVKCKCNDAYYSFGVCDKYIICNL